MDRRCTCRKHSASQAAERCRIAGHGIRTFGDHGVTLDIGAIPMVKERSHLPVLVDPSGPAGGTSRVPPLALAAQGAGADGLIVEVHAQPDQARSGGPSQLDPSGFRALMDVLGVGRTRREVDLVDRAAAHPDRKTTPTWRSTIRRTSTTPPAGSRRARSSIPRRRQCFIQPGD